MRKACLYLISVISLALIVCSNNKSFMEWWADYRVDHLHLYHTRVRHGDLFSNCFLPGFTDTAVTPLKEYSAVTGNTNLYILHDSYLAGKINKNNFLSLDKLVLSDYRAGGIDIQLDPRKKNILLIEVSERTTWRFFDTATAVSKFRVRHTTKLVQEPPKEIPFLSNVFNPNINQNLEFNLFDYECFIPLKSLKASINYSLFNRIPKDIAISTDNNYLLLSQTVDLQDGYSSFGTFGDNLVEATARAINVMNMCFKKAGFDEVYFSIIPNTASIVDRKRNLYNNKIQKIEQDTALRTKFIDIYQTFLHTHKRVYRRDDTHWNSAGLQLWVDEVNRSVLSK